MRHRRQYGSVLAALVGTLPGLPSARTVCDPAAQPLGRTADHLQLQWDACDLAQNPVDPYWLDPSAPDAGVRPSRTKPPSTSGSDCKGFPSDGTSLSLPAGCASAPFWISVPEHGIQKLSCKHLRYLPDFFRAFFSTLDLYGHANLDVVALTGKAQFAGQAQPDLDYNFALVNPANARTEDNPTLADGRAFVEIEFYAPETVDLFRGTWWQGLRDEVAKAGAPESQRWWNALLDMIRKPDQKRWQPARDYVGETDVYAVGLFGLDCQHGCATELHPVYGLALRGSAPAGGDRWAFFARNRGSEGFCSNGKQIDYDLQYLQLLLTPPRGQAATFADAPRIAVWRHPADASVRWTLIPVQEGAVLLIDFGREDQRSQILEGEVVIQWR